MCICALKKYTWRKKSFEDLLSNINAVNKMFLKYKKQYRKFIFYAEQPTSNHTAYDATAFIKAKP